MTDIFRPSLMVSSMVFQVAFVHLVYTSALFLASCCCSFLLHVVTINIKLLSVSGISARMGGYICIWSHLQLFMPWKVLESTEARARARTHTHTHTSFALLTQAAVIIEGDKFIFCWLSLGLFQPSIWTTYL